MNLGMKNIVNIYPFLNLVLFDLFKTNHSNKDPDKALQSSVEWLCLAQDSSPDGGVSEGYHLIHGWLPSYPETTGYIIETIFDYSKHSNDVSLRDRAIRMADWLVKIQYEDGAIPDSYFSKKMVFDTGQVLFGFVRAFQETGDEKYKQAAIKAGKWLIEVQDTDGAWRKYAVGGIPHTYYARVAWSMLQLHSITDDDLYKEHCEKNIDWVIKQQIQNGWFDNAAFTLKKNNKPYTHTIAYTIRGVLESGIYLQKEEYIESARLAIDSIYQVLPENGCFSGSYDRNWKGDQKFSCLTGNAQLAIIFFKLYKITGDNIYLNTGSNINKCMLSRQEMRVKNINILGGMAGSYPVWGEYIHYMYPNWASKFFTDSLLIEKNIEL
jgi:hypothetical protein